MSLENKSFRWLRIMLIVMLAFIASTAYAQSEESQVTDEHPNILFLVVDDMGYSDIGPFGSEIETPNLDMLAQNGMTFTNFHASGSCSPSRSMMLTGVDNHLNGLGTMDHRLPNVPTQQGKPGYEGYLNESVVTVAKVLNDAGYHTYQAGKWHLGHEEHQLPLGRGFERHYTMVPGGGSHYADQYEYTVVARKAPYVSDGVELESLPEDFYSTTMFTDKIIEYIGDDQAQDDMPFFAYVAYTAPHAPLQAPQEFIDKYKGRYDQGWDVLREERFERMKEMGLIPSYLEMPERWHGLTSWEDHQDKANAAKRMEVYAAMIDYVDHSVGRLIDYLKEIDEYEDTMIVFISDNGADEHDNIGLGKFAWPTTVNPNTGEKYFDNSTENIGTTRSFQSLNQQWAQVSATPFYGAKGVMTEGGIRAPLIISYPNGNLIDGLLHDGFASVMDLTPTWLDYAEVEHPGDSYDGRPIYPMNGRSMRPMLEDGALAIYGPDEGIGFELYGTINKALFMGDWKITRVGDRPWGKGAAEPWKLFNLRMDPTELTDLSALYPAQLEKMVAAYEQYEEDVGFVSVTPDPIPFDSPQWTIDAEESEIVEFAGREALKLTAGSAMINNANFTNGVLEFDMAFESAAPGFAGALFRTQQNGDHERFYMLPHRSGQGDATQITPVISGMPNWQLYHGNSYSGAVDYPIGEWFHVKIVVSNNRAEIFVVDRKDSLLKTTLQLDAESGGVGVFAQATGGPASPAYFSNFNFAPSLVPARITGGQQPAPPADGTILSWQVSDAFPEADVMGVLQLAEDATADSDAWDQLDSEPTGLANLTRLNGRESIAAGNDTVYARAIIESDGAQVKQLDFGYSDRARVYLNGQLVFSGDSTVDSRGFNYLGNITYNDKVYLSLADGENELVVAVSETLGGWGVQAQFADPEGITVPAPESADLNLNIGRRLLFSLKRLLLR